MRYISLFLGIAGLQGISAMSTFVTHESSNSTCLRSRSSDARATCDALSTAYPGQIFFPNSPKYITESRAIWSQEAWKSPACVFSPFTAVELAGGMKRFAATNTSFAVRSGGHMPVAGHNSIGASGVMVATTHFTELRTVYSPNSFGMNYLRAGAAFRWQEVYDFLDARGFRAIGGRVGSIGSGLLLGGGLSYFSSVHGWAANNVVNYEIVLANGSIIEVNNRSAPDLFWALKGGSNNFGIITRFDLKIYASNEVWGGLAVYAPEDNQKYLDAQTAFILPGGGSDDPKAALMPNFGYDPTTKQSSTSAFLVYDAPTENHKAFENFTSLRTTSRNLGVQNISKVVSISAGFEPRDRRWSFAQISISSSKMTMNLITKTIRENADRLLAGVNCTVGAAIQPVSVSHLQAARDHGGDPMDLDPAKGGFVLALIYGEWFDKGLDVKIRQFSDATITSLEKQARSHHLYYPFTFLNDAGIRQDPVATYGYGKSRARMMAIAKRYDPEGVFQRNCPGFKLTGDVHAS